jgi:methylenetetrahydrofolate--tRNA-(uracil-5-)-methyltransferase
VFALIPGLEQARFERFGSVHRNTFVDAPRVLDEQLQLLVLPSVYLAGQITGVEGYVESAACGLCAGIMLAARLRGAAVQPPPTSTALGALLSHLRRPSADFQPSNAVWSMFAPLPQVGRLSRKDRRAALAARALAELEPWLAAAGGARRQAALPAQAVGG